MSTKTSRKEMSDTKKNNAQKNLKSPESESVPSGEEEEVPRDIRTVEIMLEVIKNLKPSFPMSLVHVSTQYGGETLDVSEKTAILDEEAKMAWLLRHEFDASTLNDVEDFLIKPLIFTVYESQGELNPEMFNISDIMDLVPVDSSCYDSDISVYECLTGNEVDSFVRKKKDRKGKKDKKISVKTKEKKKKDKKKAKKSKEPKKGKKKKKSKKKEDEAQIIGMGTLDLLPLIMGNKTFDDVVEIRPMFAFEDERMITFKNMPMLHVKVSIDRELRFPMEPSILSFTAESIFNIPQTIAAPGMFCNVCVWLPVSHEFENKMVFVDDTNPSRTLEIKGWPNVEVLGDNANTTKYSIRSDFQNIVYPFRENISHIIKKDSPRRVFNVLHRSLMLDFNKNILINYLLRYRKMLIEFLVISGKVGSNLNALVSKKSKTSPLHLMALVDISSLLYPGVTTARMVCQLSTYHANEILEATGIQDSHFKPKQKAAANGHRPGHDKHSKKSDVNLKAKKGAKKKSKKEPSATAITPTSLTVIEEPSMKIYNEDGDPTVIIIEIEMTEPLVPNQPLEELTAKLQDLIPVKSDPTSDLLSWQVVEAQYKQIIDEISADLNQHLLRYIQEKKRCTNEVQANFLTYLCRMGVYQHYILMLKSAIASLVGKKYGSFDVIFRKSNKQHQYAFGRIFTYLVCQMNHVLNSKLCTVEKSRSQETPLAAYWFYAKEACELKRYTMAEKYLTQRLCFEERNPDVWFDYALFQLEMDSSELAFEYLHEALSRNVNHPNSLLAYGILLADKGKMDEAETCFMTALAEKPRWVEAWGILFLFHQKKNNTGGMIFAEDMANRYLGDDYIDTDYMMTNEDLVWTTKVLPRTFFFRTAAFLLKLRMYYWSEDALSFEILKHPGMVNYLLAAMCYYRENFDHALNHLHEAKLIEGWNYALVSLTGHCLIAKSDYETAKEQLLYVLGSFDPPEDLYLVYVNCAKAMNALGEDQEARRIMLKACEKKSTPNSWTVLGTLFFNRNDLLSAEECFAEANTLDNTIPEVWGFLTLINLKRDKGGDAELCYKQALKNELKEKAMITLILHECENFRKRNRETGQRITEIF